MRLIVKMIAIEPSELEAILSRASESTRKRVVKPFHKPDYNGVRAMLNAIMPGSYVQPHKHCFPGGNEIWTTVKGKTVEFDETGNVLQHVRLGDVPFVEIPEGVYHMAIAIEPSVMLEISRGPYNPNIYKEFAKWAPSEEEIDTAERYLRGILQKCS